MNLQQDSIKNAYQSVQDKTNTQLVISTVAAALNIDQKLLSFYMEKCQLPLQLSTPTNEQEITTLFQHFKQNQQDVQKQFNEQQSLESPLIQLIPLSQGNSNYKQNKRNIGRFIRDQHEHYEECLRSHLENKDQDKIIMARNMHSFLKDLFTFKNFQLNLKSGSSSHFFQSQNSHQVILNAIKTYFNLVKAVDINIQESNITQQEILDFIECWIRTDGDIVATYIYQNKHILANAFQQPEITTVEAVQLPKTISKQMENATPNTAGQFSIQQTIRQTIDKYEKMLSLDPPQSQRSIILNTIMSLQQQLKKIHNRPEQNVGVSHEAVGQIMDEQCQLQLFRVFKKECWKNYNLGKHTTFQDIYHQTLTMRVKDFEVFRRNFDLVPQQALDPQKQKTCYITKNTKDLDFAYFCNVIKDILRKHPQYAERFKKKLMATKCPGHIMKHAKNDYVKEDVKYQFKIMPHSGKTEEEIMDQLKHRRVVKETSRGEYQIRKAKEEIRFLKKMGLNKKAQQFVNDINKKGISNKKLQYLLPAAKQPQKLTIENLDKFKDKYFDPRKLIDDEPLEEYKPEVRKRLARRASETRVREVDQSQRSREYVLKQTIDRKREQSLKKGLRVLEKLRK